MTAADALFAPINFDAEVYQASDCDARIQAIRDAIGDQLARCQDDPPTWVAPGDIPVTRLDSWVCENYRILLRRIAELQADLDELIGSPWQPIETLPIGYAHQFIAYWQRSINGVPEIDMMGSRREYEEILGYGEPPATHWMSLEGPERVK